MEYTPVIEPNVISILAIVDGRTIRKNYPNPSTDPNNPTLIQNPEKVIFTIVKDKRTGGHIEQKLNFEVKLSDEIRWHSSSLAGGSGYKIQGYKYKLVSGKALITTPQMQTSEIVLPVPNPADPLHPKQFQKIIEYEWSAAVANFGAATYDCCFAILNRQGTAIGYFHCNMNVMFIENSMEEDK